MIGTMIVEETRLLDRENFSLVTRVFLVSILRKIFSDIGRRCREFSRQVRIFLWKLGKTESQKHEGLFICLLNMTTSTLDILYTTAGNLDISYIFVYYRQSLKKKKYAENCN